MLGNEKSPGIMPRAVKELYDIIAEKSNKDIEYKFVFGYYEIYNENIRDLLKEDNQFEKLEIQEDPILGNVINGLTILTLPNSTEVFKILV